MTIRVGINGFGRIGRCTLSHIAASGRNDIQVVKLNATGPLKSAAHLIKYDSVHGAFPGMVEIGENTLDLGRGPIDVMSTYDMDALDWEGCDVVLECTGMFNDGLKAKTHLERGAGKVLLSAPGKNVDRTVVYGVNDKELTKIDRMVSNGSCTTNCLAPLAKALDDAFGIESGLMTTIHSYTGDQPTLDKRHSDLYRARAAAMSIIPTSTGAAKALGEVLPKLAGKLDGTAMRVPTPNVSAVDLTFVAGRDVTVDEVNAAMKAASEGPMSRVLAYDDEQKVSVDFNHTEHSSIFAPDQTKVTGGNLVRVLAWYDNEWAFSCRMADVAVAMGRLS
ncbi:type I glyceraldehyde-3-phosphate dehydrogenase [Sulfitobacter pseudonitzschiae]|uniref:Type I glyceraldehyde-3-phosphate dehydrogenase n=1 Tax=Pseudosulfitobacter pseudonitzschiae TaxID=1402135 RepID=A0A9Q2NR78_9RHOB|nr:MULTISPECIES: type I glyceraldehyde-3-phosphate dehydrogenase [Roseobacteraceae]MBM2291155.1 type I glyceraldehyde-3-phosphate dehydrogenase [Pseudosulfitobacter pseudonitzschiae]MBM2296073.1 type I glyceraldehyde-3-phosphate dehydrogenase [Pseudosulfitobacter pseudonitzschiae]MBM2300986.1 type I glyceraldehyde-3-phosphate dehydrogenase [Pseudosulfitobacter pseudonitzschiae]MBM2310770.1 type I glyceraldehyde-3-phosphate dehydrogenase [Pseudosulfitobacter pseudonitzschiae]MBM2315683.1 type I|tara:strand:+ start:944 stop:1945 length:1002 start_codon:yes stop_codon:yes gene_type:complete